MYKKVSVKERKPALNKFVTTIDKAGEHRVYRLTENGWDMRDANGTNSPNDNLPIIYWLEEVNIIDRIQTFADVEAITGITLTQRVDETNDEFAYRQAKLIAQAYNEGNVLNPTDTKQNKYFPWFLIDTNPSGVGLSFRDNGYWNASAYIGVRLCFCKKEHSIDAGKKFISIYSNLLIK